jgi:hypothetical protein
MWSHVGDLIRNRCGFAIGTDLHPLSVMQYLKNRFCPCKDLRLASGVALVRNARRCYRGWRARRACMRPCHPQSLTSPLSQSTPQIHAVMIDVSFMVYCSLTPIGTCAIACHRKLCRRPTFLFTVFSFITTLVTDACQ